MSGVEVRMKMSPLQAGKMYMENIRLEEQLDDLEYKNKRLLEALQAAYRKHVANDDSIGWHELSDIMSCALPEVMGDAEFCAWVEKRFGH